MELLNQLLILKLFELLFIAPFVLYFLVALPCLWILIGLWITNRLDNVVLESFDNFTNKHFPTVKPVIKLLIYVNLWPYFTIVHIRYKYFKHLNLIKFISLSLLHVWVIICLGIIGYRAL